MLVCRSMRVDVMRVGADVLHRAHVQYQQLQPYLRCTHVHLTDTRSTTSIKQHKNTMKFCIHIRIFPVYYLTVYDRNMYLLWPTAQ